MQTNPTPDALVERLGKAIEKAIWADTKIASAIEYGRDFPSETRDNLARAALDATTLVAMQERIERLEKALERLTTAVEALPVEEWVEADRHGGPELLGYVMQAQGEWDEARRAAEEARTALGRGE